MELHRALGLTDAELDAIVALLGRRPNELELAMYAVMWSEHCSYKSSRLYLRRLPTEGPGVLVGPGENAGVIDAGDGVAVAMRIESHNHPSAIEPHQGAATGVGGILRDVFTMGARPIALMDSLCFGPLSGLRARWLLDGVVGGISSYGNSVGVPTVGGSLTFDTSYAANPLVNVFCLGVLPVSRLVLARAEGVGNLAVLLGSTTGRDGIGGVSVLASAELSGEQDDAKRPSVQVGDPFEEKRLIEACLELLESGLVVGLQDLGGAGLTCAASETAARAGLGMDLDVSAVPLREPAMAPVEIMTSESQERMLAIVRPGDVGSALGVCERWDVRATVVGVVTAAPPDGAGRLRVLDGRGGGVLADLPAATLSDGAPLYGPAERPLAPPADLAQRRLDDPARLPAPEDVGADVLSLAADASWVWRQYDHQLFANTVAGPGGDATVLRLAEPGVTRPGGGAPGVAKALAISTDGNGRWCSIDPRLGAALAVAEAALNVACTGARPAALVNCLNLGNPEHPEVMWALSEIVDGMAEACKALGIPVVGGNVSLYNGSEGADIDPTPIVAVVGLIDRLGRRPPGVALTEGASLVLLGSPSDALAGSRWATELRGHRNGAPPPLDLAAHAALVDFVSGVVGGIVALDRSEPDADPGSPSLVAGLHDVSDGGLGLALAELAALSGIGLRVGGIAGHAELFSEAPSRVVVCTEDPAALATAAGAAGIPFRKLGVAGGDRFVVEGLVDLPLERLDHAWRSALPDAMAAPAPAV